MANLINGKEIAAKVKEDIAKEAGNLAEYGVTPGLAVIIVGDDPASKIYVRNKKKACEEVGFYSEEFALPEKTSQKELLALIDTLNKRDGITIIMISHDLDAAMRYASRICSSPRMHPCRDPYGIDGTMAPNTTSFMELYHVSAIQGECGRPACGRAVEARLLLARLHRHHHGDEGHCR